MRFLWPLTVEKLRTDAKSQCFFIIQLTQRDIVGGKSAVPEKDPFLIVFAPGLLARNDLTQLRVQRLLRQLARAGQGQRVVSQLRVASLPART